MRPTDAYVAVRTAQPAWAARDLAERVRVLRRFGELIDHQRDALAKVVSDETRKPISQARNELAGVVPRVQFFVDETQRVLAAETVFDDGGMTEQITFEPLGVVLNISAWNYPWFVGSNVFVPALLA